MSDILNLLARRCPHALHGGAPNIAGGFTNIVQDGKLLPAALAPKQRGVVFDVGRGMRAPPATAPFARGRCGGLAWADNPN
jgi:predicted amidohydrolase